MDKSVRFKKSHLSFVAGAVSRKVKLNSQPISIKTLWTTFALLVFQRIFLSRAFALNFALENWRAAFCLVIELSTSLAPALQ
jgi:hypothetical protein